MPKCLTLAAALLSIGIVPAYAVKSTSPTIAAKHAELKTVQSKILAVDNNIEHLQAQQEGIQQQLAELDKKIGEHAAILKDLKHQISQKSQDVKTTGNTIRAQIEGINKQKQSLNDQVIAAYHSGQHDRLQLLLNNQDPLLSSRLLVYYDYLNKMRMQAVAQIETDVRQLELLQDKQKQEVDFLNEAIQSKQAEQKQLAETKKLRAVVLKQLHNELLDDKTLLNQLKSNEYALKSLLNTLQPAAENKVSETIAASPRPGETKQNLSRGAKLAKQEAVKSKIADAEPDIAKIDQEPSPETSISIEKSHTEFDLKESNNSFSQRKGRLSWPVAGKVRTAAASDSAEDKRNGILIEAPEGNPVRTVAKGTIAFAGWLRGYGMLTIVNHGDGYMTVYAFNQSLYKKVGNQVNAGEVIASVGQSGGQNRTGLYFEIRKSGLPLNPETWCKK